jgi:hypothetical protein
MSAIRWSVSLVAAIGVLAATLAAGNARGRFVVNVSQ